MLLCLSSGFTPRYREDVLRAIAMPIGSELRFRYELRLIPESLKKPIANDELQGTRVCIAYLDRSDQGRKPEVVPCRQAVLRKSDTPGDFCVLDFELGEFWFAPDVQAFNREIRAKCGNLPDWEEAKLKGDFCCRLDSIPASLTTSSDIKHWQKLIKCLKEHSDFADEPFFYHVTGIFPSGEKEPVVPKEGAYKVLSNGSYEIRIIQFSPGETNEATAVKEINWILAECDAQSMSFVTNKRLAVDSGYDEKLLRFRAGNCVNRVDSMISLFRHIRVTETPRTSDAIWDFDLRIHVEPRTWTAVWQGSVVGLLIAFQGLAAILANANIGDKLWPSIAVVVAGLLTGFAASFGLRKP